MKIAYLSLGTNLGDRMQYLKEAVLHLHVHEAINVEKLSSIYETEPVGYTNQPEFLNMVVKISTLLTPMELLEETAAIEKNLGRKRTIRWGPRTIDVDILLYDRLKLETDVLQIPHPRLTERAFVLIPLAEIHPKLAIPDSKLTFAEQIRQIPDKEGVRIWKQNNGEGKFELFES
ncbi:MAG TPA: 2-amino-4-hydroxy-6-hydroxymethyldihydropteridine diphosphokinase [Bacillales bacterium]|nr:2-amino-4-hydroxy-6-hydroxymethyldihydropteridine diphosphokinase [Bacillales bacterium]